MKLLIIFLFFSSIVLSQGPVDGFFKGKGNLDVALSGFYQKSNKFYSGIGELNYPRTLSGVSIFSEFGILENFDVIVSIPFINLNFQDAGIYLKYRLFRKRLGESFPLAVIPALGVSFPLSKYETQTGGAIGQRATQIQPKLVLQYKMKYGFFIQVQSGYNHTLDPVPSSIPVSAKIGFSHNKIYSDIWYDYQKGLGVLEWMGGASQDFRTFHVNYSKIGGVFYYGVNPKLGFFVNSSLILTGINLGKSFSIGGGVVCKFSFIDPVYK